MRTKGKLTKWNDDKGFGFITPNAGNKQVFIHVSAFNNRSKRPEINQEITYTLSADKNGRPRAENATLPGDKLRKKGTFSIFLSLLFIFGICVLCVSGKLPLSLLAIYFVISMITLLHMLLTSQPLKEEHGVRVKVHSIYCQLSEDGLALFLLNKSYVINHKNNLSASSSGLQFF